MAMWTRARSTASSDMIVRASSPWSARTWFTCSTNDVEPNDCLSKTSKPMPPPRGIPAEASAMRSSWTLSSGTDTAVPFASRREATFWFLSSATTLPASPGARPESRTAQRSVGERMVRKAMSAAAATPPTRTRRRRGVSLPQSFFASSVIFFSSLAMDDLERRVHELAVGLEHLVLEGDGVAHRDGRLLGGDHDLVDADGRIAGGELLGGGGGGLVGVAGVAQGAGQGVAEAGALVRLDRPRGRGR